MDNMITSLIQMEQQLRILHWQTKSYARHQAFGGTYSALGDLIDKFVEVYMGKKGRIQLHAGCTVDLLNLEEIKAAEFCDASVSLLISLCSCLDPKTDSDLMNIRDEMLSEINKLKYLLTLQ